MILASPFRQLCAALVTIGCLTQCASSPTPSPAYNEATHATWVRYLKLSPLSNPTPSASFARLAEDIRNLPRTDVDDLVKDHLRRVASMLDSVPAVRQRAEAAAEQARKEVQGYKPLGEKVGEALGENSADEDASHFNRWAHGQAGGFLGGLFVEAVAASSASSAREGVLAKFRHEMEVLVTNESFLNSRLGYPNSPMMNSWCERIFNRNNPRPRPVMGAGYYAPYPRVNVRVRGWR